MNFDRTFAVETDTEIFVPTADHRLNDAVLEFLPLGLVEANVLYDFDEVVPAMGSQE
jgi:hypothetical protein